MLLVDMRSIAFNHRRWWFLSFFLSFFLCLFVCLSVCLIVSTGHLESFVWISHIGKCAVHAITYKQSVIYLLVVCSFLPKITTMTTILPATAPKRTKVPGGTMLVIRPTLMACILMVHIPLMPMESNGTRSEVTTILWNAQRWKLKPNFKSLEPGSSNIPSQEQLFI